ncbi:MAG: peptidylprolyl isomerase [Bacteroidetes bacterium]|nr:MAG: peptidylprolyl isomerase [Bacteroidota bacterium]
MITAFTYNHLPFKMHKLTRLNNVFWIVTLLFFIQSCQSPRQEKNEPDAATMRENLLGANAILLDAEDQEIRDFISRHGWEMKETGSGLRYMIYHEGDGEKARKDQIAVFHYSLRLITGDLVYSSQESGMAEFRLGQGGVESGLEEGFKLLRVGDKARFILPSHLAHGVPGDGAKIPRRATLIYDIELAELK